MIILITHSGWHVKDRHAVARDDFWLWNLYGRPNQYGKPSPR